MQTVDREGFIMWTEGTLLHFEGGKGCIAPERDCISAKKALDAGETIALTDDGKIVSYMKSKDGYYKEFLKNE